MTAVADSHQAMALLPRRLRQILIALMVALALALGVAMYNRAWWAGALDAEAILILLIAYRINRAGKVRRAAGIMLATLTVIVSGLVCLSQGIHDEAVLAFPGLLIFASMFAGRRLFFGLLATISLVLAMIVGADMTGWHPSAVRPSDWGQLINVLAILNVTAFFVWLMSGDLRRAMQRLQADNQRILESYARIDTLAHRDSLTNLPNRTLAMDRLSQIIAGARRSGSMAAVLFLDLDHFKTVNDSLGHSAGDELLCLVAERLTDAVRQSDTVSRLGGDEFLLLMAPVEDEDGASVAAGKIMAQLSAPMRIHGLEVSVTASLGIALYPKDGSDSETLLKHADLAMYRAKDSGRNAWRFFDADMNASVVEHLHLSAGMRVAMTNGEFRVYYQPQYELATGRIVGAEALIRWKHPSLGYIPPGKFIPVAERTGLINEIGAWVLETACKQAQTWQAMGHDLLMAVNVSPVQFRRDDIEREVANAIECCGLNPTSLELELTESLLVADSAHLSGVLDRLRAIGIKIAIDDFGTGYSNLGYLKRFAVQRLKIDQSFVRDIVRNANNDGIVRAIIEMAHCLQLEVVAEGVEDAATLDRLVALGCEFGQGYLWSPALPAADFQSRLLGN